MANRHLSRSIAMQSLFEWDFRSMSDVNIDEVISRNTEEFAPGVSDTTFTKKLLMGF